MPFFALALAGCEPFSILGDGPTVTEGEDRLGVRSDSLEFGTVSASGQPAEQVLHVENLGDSEVAVYVDGSGIDGTDFFLLTESRIFSLGVGESQDLSVWFAPTMDGTADATLVLEPGELVVNLHGLGTAPVASFSEVDLGNVVVGCEKRVGIPITNEGTEALEIRGATTESVGFSVTSTMVSVEPGETAEVEVSFSPSAAAAYAGEVLVNTNDPQQPRISIPLAGTGDDGERDEETFSYELGNPTDIMLLVDSGASMAGYLGRGITSSEVFAEVLRESGIDYHFVALNLDGTALLDDSGTQAGQGYATADSSAASLESMVNKAFASTLTPQTEDLLEIARAALDEAEGGGPLAGFRRNDASLHLIGVTDGPTDADFAAELAELRGDVLAPYETYVSTITSASSCAGRAISWAAAARETGGREYDLCEPDWSLAMEGLAGLNGNADDLTFLLAGDPIADTVEVYVESVRAAGWSYDASINAVIFEADSKPPLGATIAVRYVDTETCEP